jgi:dTDP-3-amino-3,4,6-trideoxy-alpha-D-glucose transaminase
MPIHIPQNDPQRSLRAIKQKLGSAFEEVIESGQYILGSQTAAFERAWSSYLGVASCVGVANGTDALYLALRAVEIGPGDEVITVSHTAIATISAIVRTGATPVLVDIDPQTYTLDPAHLADAWSGRTRAIVPVHLYGGMADMDHITTFAEQRGLVVIEDCAQAHGSSWGQARAGSLGKLAAFSFYPTKNLGAMGDAGAVVTNQPDLLDRLRALRQYGWDSNRVSQSAGDNSRLDELQAAILRARLPQLDLENDRRRQLAARYDAALTHLPLRIPTALPSVTHTYHQYVIQVNERDSLRQFLAEQGIGTQIHYGKAAHQQPGYARLVRCVGHLPVTEQAVSKILSLPMFPALLDLEQDAVIQAISAFFGT